MTQPRVWSFACHGDVYSSNIEDDPLSLHFVNLRQCDLRHFVFAKSVKFWAIFTSSTKTIQPDHPQGFSIAFHFPNYHIYSINRPGRLLNFRTLRVGAYSRRALIRGWALIKFLPFSTSEVCVFCNKTINADNRTRRSNKAMFL